MDLSQTGSWFESLSNTPQPITSLQCPLPPSQNLVFSHHATLNLTFVYKIVCFQWLHNICRECSDHTTEPGGVVQNYSKQPETCQGTLWWINNKKYSKSERTCFCLIDSRANYRQISQKIIFFEIQEVLKLINEFSVKRAAKGTGFKNCCLLRLFCLKQSSKSSFLYNIWVVK